MMSLEADAASARGGFACLFSSAEEFETAVISERRAQGRYDQARSLWPVVMFIGCAMLVAGSGAAAALSGGRRGRPGRRRGFSFCDRHAAGLETGIVRMRSQPR